MSTQQPRLFVLRRDRDVTGVSGSGNVADGVQWPDGTVVLRWRERPSTSVWDSLELMLSVHGHDGATHVVWADEMRREIGADIIEAFDVPAWLAGPETEREILRRQVSRAIESVQDGHAAPVEVGDERIVDALMPIVGQLLDQRDRAQASAGRAYKLADRWEAAHGSAGFLVRVAGAELRDELDDSGTEAGGVVHAAPNAQASEPKAVGDSGLRCVCGDPVEWMAHHDEPGWIHAPGSDTTCLHPRPRCPECQMPHLLVPGQPPMCRSIRAHLDAADAVAAAECSAQYTRFSDDRRQCIRAAQHRGDHIDERGFHWSDTVAVYPVVGDMEVPRQHYAGPDAQPCTKHRGRAERQKYGCNGPDPADQGPPNQGPLTGIEVRDPCPYCEDCPLIPRALMDDHLREHHPEMREGGPSTPVPDATSDLRTNLHALRGKLAAGPAPVSAAERIEDLLRIVRQHADALDLVVRQREELRQEQAEAAQLSHQYRNAAERAEAAVDRVRAVLADARKWALPRSQLASYIARTEEALSDTRLGTTDRQTCPYCPGGPRFLHSELAEHVQSAHARVLAALARGVSLDELLHDPEAPGRLPHEMET